LFSSNFYGELSRVKAVLYQKVDWKNKTWEGRLWRCIV